MSESQALIVVTDGQLVAGTQYQIALADLAERAKLITRVDSANMYAEALEICARAKSYMKSIEASAEPERIRLRGELANLSTKRDRMAAAFIEVVAPLEQMANAWKAAERKAAQLEQDTLNKKRNGQEPIKVQPNIPSVAGTRAHVNYSAELLPNGRNAILLAYVSALEKAKRVTKKYDKELWQEHAEYLEKFITIDQQALNAEARKVKSAKTLESLIPGIRAHETDRI